MLFNPLAAAASLAQLSRDAIDKMVVIQCQTANVLAILAPIVAWLANCQ
jgi:hypothetical protein